MSNNLLAEESRRNKAGVIRRMHTQAETREAEERQRTNDEREKQNRERTVASQKTILTNPRWFHKDPDLRNTKSGYAEIGDTIILQVDQQYGDGKPLQIKVCDNLMPVTVDPEKVVKTLSKTMDSSTVQVEWEIKDPRPKNDRERDFSIFFYGTAEGEFCENCEVDVREAVSQVRLRLLEVTEVFAPSVECCEIRYDIEEGEITEGDVGSLIIKNGAGDVVFEDNNLPLSNTESLVFEWDGKNNDGNYMEIIESPYSVNVQYGDNEASTDENSGMVTEVKISELVLNIPDVDNNNRLINNSVYKEVSVVVNVLLQKSDGSSVQTEVPVNVLYSFEDPSGTNLNYLSSYQWRADSKLGKSGDPDAQFWMNDFDFNTSSDDSYKLTCCVKTISDLNSEFFSKTRAFFLPSGVGGDQYKVTAKVLSSDSLQELATIESEIFTIWRKIHYTQVYSMSGETYLDNATVHAEIGPAFETTGTNGAYVLYERGDVQVLPTDLSIDNIGLYDAASPTRMANWPNDFSPANFEAFPNEMDPTTQELTDYSYTGSDPTLLQTKAAAKIAIENKATLWFNRVYRDIHDRANNWYAAIGIDSTQSALLAIKHYHPKMNGNPYESYTNFWPRGISITIPNIRTNFDPDLNTWEWIQGLNYRKVSVIIKNHGTAARLKTICRHEIGHGTKFAFAREWFGGSQDHSNSGLMHPSGMGLTFSTADAQKLRGGL